MAVRRQQCGQEDALQLCPLRAVMRQAMDAVPSHLSGMHRHLLPVEEDAVACSIVLRTSQS